MIALVEVAAGALLVAASLRVGLTVRPAKPESHDPAKYGHPMAGFASARDAHMALTRQGAAERPKFKD